MLTNFFLRTKLFIFLSFICLNNLFLIPVHIKRKFHEYFKIIRKITRAASQAGDADSSRTPGLNSSVQRP